MTFRSDSIGGGGMLVPMGPLEIMEPSTSRHSTQLHTIFRKVTRGFKLKTIEFVRVPT
jgi:hypothetical protein